MHKQFKRSSAFTLVELLVVVMVIAMLATITVVLYSNAQVQARDTAVRNAARQFAEAVQLMSVKNKGVIPYGGYASTTPATANGCIDGRNGWQQPGQTNPSFVCTLGDAAVAQGILPATFFDKLPKNKVMGDNKSVINTQDCDGKTYVLYSLEDPSDKEASDFAALSASCASVNQNAEPYGMRAGFLLDINHYY